LHENTYKYCFVLKFSKEKENVTSAVAELWNFKVVEQELRKYLYENVLILE